MKIATGTKYTAMMWAPQRSQILIFIFCWNFCWDLKSNLCPLLVQCGRETKAKCLGPVFIGRPQNNGISGRLPTLVHIWHRYSVKNSHKLPYVIHLFLVPSLLHPLQTSYKHRPLQQLENKLDLVRCGPRSIRSEANEEV